MTIKLIICHFSPDATDNWIQTLEVGIIGKKTEKDTTLLFAVLYLIL